MRLLSVLITAIAVLSFLSVGMGNVVEDLTTEKSFKDDIIELIEYDYKSDIDDPTKYIKVPHAVGVIVTRDKQELYRADIFDSFGLQIAHSLGMGEPQNIATFILLPVTFVVKLVGSFLT